MTKRTQPRLAPVRDLIKPPPELTPDAPSDARRPGNRHIIEHHRTRHAGSSYQQLIGYRDLRGERHLVHERQRQRLPRVAERTTDGDEAGDPRTEHALVVWEGHRGGVA